jgi:hypothetical protein
MFPMWQTDQTIDHFQWVIQITGTVLTFILDKPKAHNLMFHA